MGNKKVFSLILVIGFFVLVCLGLLYFLFFTTKGSGFMAKLIISRYVRSENVKVENMEGSFNQRFVSEDIEIKDLPWLPPGSVLRVKRLEVDLTSFAALGPAIKIINARLRLPNSEAILFSGTYKEYVLDANAYCRQIDVKAFLDLFAETKKLKNISGIIDGLDVYITGSFTEPQLKGELKIRKLSHKGFLIEDCPVFFAISLRTITDELALDGEICLNSGTLSGPRTARITLLPSKILFSGDPRKPSFDIKGTSKVEDTKINIGLKGPLDAPEIKLASEPALPQDKLLLMLSTGKSWKGTQVAMEQNKVTPDLARDFLDYFVFGGSGSKIAKKFGISDVSLKFDATTKEIGVTKELSNKASASYAVEQSQATAGNVTTKHKIGGEYKVTDSLSIGAEKELNQESADSPTKQATDDKVTIKYKKDF